MLMFVELMMMAEGIKLCSKLQCWSC